MSMMKMYYCYLWHADKMLKYFTTNRDGYREYKRALGDCIFCPYLTSCPLSKNHRKTVTCYVLWEDYMENCEGIRYTRGIKENYEKRKEAIERIFGTAKEMHGLRYTNMVGKAWMEMEIGLTYLCMNLKRLEKIKDRYGLLRPLREYLSRLLMQLST